MKLSNLLSIAAIFLSIAATTYSINSYHQASEPELSVGTTAVLPIAGSTYSLAGSGISSSATSITLTSFTIPQNGYPIQDGDLSNTFYITVEPSSKTRQEIVSCTTDVQNANGTATFSGCTRGLSPVTPYIASSSLQFPHAGGSSVVFSNPPQLYNQFLAKDNDGTITASTTWTATTTFSNGILFGYTCDALSNNLAGCPKTYIDNVVSSGAATANRTTKGLVEIATGKEIASSTQLGGSGAFLVIPAELASSSPGNNATSTVVVTDTNGKIRTSFIDQVSTYVWSGLHTFSNIFVTGSTTIAASNTNRLNLNGVSTAFPPSVAASSTILMSNASGQLFYVSPGYRVSNSSASLTTANTATTTLQTNVIPANTISLNAPMRVTAQWSNLGGGTCYYYMFFGNGSATTTIAIGTGGSGGSLAQSSGMIFATSTSAENSTIITTYNLSPPGTFSAQNLYAVASFPNYSLASTLYFTFSAQQINGATCGLVGATIETLPSI